MLLVWVCLIIVLVQAAFAVLAIRHYGALPSIPRVPRRSGLPRVSIIIPARNEASNLARLLPSLLNLDYGSYEIIVVDDASSDATAAIAAEFDAIVIRGGGPPRGWTGKNYACHLGANVATGDWLLFTDADTEHAPLALASAMGYALDRQLDALSIMTGQDCFSFWERLLLPFAYQQYFVGVPGAQVNHGRTADAIANGQYILIRRAVYDRIDGHEAVRGSVVEDVRLAQVLRAHGARLLVARGEALVHVRMYRGLRDIWEGFSKNSFQFLTLNPRRGLLVVLSTLAAGLTPLLFALGLQPGNDAVMLMAGYSYAFLVLGLMGWDRLFRVPAWYGLLHPLSVAVFTLIALNSMVLALTRRGVRWKGRTYGGRSMPVEPSATRTHSRQRPPQP
jgi:chlorobactene glucosyltransferase